MIVDKNFNIDDYKEETIKKYNLTEEEWQRVVELANMFRQIDDIAFLPILPFDFDNK